MLYYKLDKNINAQKLLEDINKLLEKNLSIPGENKILVVSLKTIGTYNGDSLLPKLTYEKNN
jgi:hypothetical protein